MNDDVMDEIRRMNLRSNIKKYNNKNLEKTTGEKSGIISNTDMTFFNSISNIYDRRNVSMYNRFNRFGFIDPYNSIKNTKEYLFFTKPDLHIYTPGTNTLNPQLSSYDFFNELHERYPNVILQLQKSALQVKTESYSPFMTILSNSVRSSLDMPDMVANTIDTSATLFGTSINYRGDAFNSDEKHDFSLEFEDSKYLELYHLFRAIEEYSRLKKFGIVSPPNINKAKVDKNGLAFSSYLQNKELHDQFSIYKFIVGEDFEEIHYFALFKGVFTKSTPRDAFSELNPDGGLKYNIQFEAQFVEDMKQSILIEFNNLISTTMALSSNPIWLNIYNSKTRTIDPRWALTPYVVKINKGETLTDAWSAPNDMNYIYKLKWRLS